LHWLGQAALNPIVFDFDSACSQGVSVTKIFLPQLSQACPPLNPTLGHPRFYELPYRLGRARARLTFSDLNRDPIPFA
jgi:ribosomal protein S12 methylthiotransferase accessory factor